MEPPSRHYSLRPPSQRGFSRSPVGEGSSPRRDEGRQGTDGILAGYDRRMEWLDVQVSALAAEVLKAVRTVGVVQDLVRSTEVRVVALEERAAGAGSLTQARHESGQFERNANLMSDGVGTSANGHQSGALVSRSHAPALPAVSADTNLGEDKSRAEILSLFDARLKESFEELHRWQGAVEGMVRQFMTEHASTRHPAPQLPQEAFETTPAHTTHTLAEDSKSNLGGPGPANLQGQVASVGRGTEAALQRLEADFAKLRSELKDPGQPLVQGKLSAPSMAWPPVTRSTPFSNILGATQPSTADLGGPLWPRSPCRFGATEPEPRAERHRYSHPEALDVEAWRGDLWRSSQQFSRKDRDVTRLYDELTRLEEEEASMRRLRPKDPADASKNDHAARRRAASTSSLAARKARPR